MTYCTNNMQHLNSRAQPLGVGGQDPLNIFIDPQSLILTELLTWGSVTLQIEMFFVVRYLKSRLFRDSPFNYIYQIERFEVQNSKKNCGGLIDPLPRPSPTLSRASPSIRASPYYSPLTFDAWLRVAPLFINCEIKHILALNVIALLIWNKTKYLLITQFRI